MNQMSGFLEKQKLGIPCPDCGKKLSKSIGWLKTHDNLVCTCGRSISLKGKEVRGAIHKAVKELTDLERTIVNTSKRLKL